MPVGTLALRRRAGPLAQLILVLFWLSCAILGAAIGAERWGLQAGVGGFLGGLLLAILLGEMVAGAIRWIKPEPKKTETIKITVGPRPPWEKDPNG